MSYPFATFINPTNWIWAKAWQIFCKGKLICNTSEAWCWPAKLESRRYIRGGWLRERMARAETISEKLRPVSLLQQHRDPPSPAPQHKSLFFSLPSGIYSIAHFCCPHMTESIQLPWKSWYIFRPWRRSGWKERKRDKEIRIYPIISFIWRRFENNSPSHLSLSDHIIHKWSLQNINSISIRQPESQHTRAEFTKS